MGEDFDAMQFADVRTLQLLQLFNFYENNPSAYEPIKLWFDCYQIIKMYKNIIEKKQWMSRLI